MSELVTLAHGNGGRAMHDLIERVFKRHLGRDALAIDADAVSLPPGEGELVITSEGCTVQPLVFAGGDIGSLAVHATVNDLAVAGADPLYLTLNAFIEEGLAVDVLEKLVTSLAEASRACGVHVLAGDTRVLPRGQGGGLYLAATGIGARRAGPALAAAHVQPGDAVLVSGPLGDHGAAILQAREPSVPEDNRLLSDSASVLPLARVACGLPGLRVMRDPTRGGLAVLLDELAQATGLGIRVREADIPVRYAVRTLCARLGHDPLQLACAGRVVAVVAADQAAALRDAWRDLDGGGEAAVIGEVGAAPGPALQVMTDGSERTLDEPLEVALARIC
jgi:hydrogenase expression/formation protein HypE